MIQTQVCKDCQTEQWTSNFKLNETTGLRHALCDSCRRNRTADHNARWEYYFRK